MDYIFDEDNFEVGAEIDAYCSRCKTDTPHTVLTKYEDEIRSVQCTTCNATHAFRPPRGEEEDDIPEPISVRRRQSLQKLPWRDAMAGLDVDASRPYSPKENYTEGQVLEHPSFGLGYVSELMSDTKLEAIFQDGRRILVYNRGDLNIVAPKRNPQVAKLVAAQLASVKEDVTVPDGQRMVANLATDLESFRTKVRGVVEMADESGDRGTVNLLDPIADGLDKKLWMMEAYLAG